MKKQTLKLLGVFVALAVVPACGGDDIFGTKCPSSGPALTSGQATYTVVASQIVDTCNPPGSMLTATDLAGDYTITTDATNCGVTLKGKSGLVIGTGTASSGAFALTYMATESEASFGGNCQYRVNITSNVTIKDEKTVEVLFNETDDMYMSLQGKTCTPPPGGACGISYTMTMTKK